MAISPTISTLGTVLFALAVLHTFLVGPIHKYAQRFDRHSKAFAILHWLAEIECVFGTWAIVMILFWLVLEGPSPVFRYQVSLSFVEPLFVFCIMILAASRPVLLSVQELLTQLSRAMARTLKISQNLCEYWIVLFLGPLSGSLITEPAAITVSALLLATLAQKGSTAFFYSLLAVLFVNVSIGGAMTPFAAPPILMVAKVWSWDFAYVFSNFGFKTLLGVFINATLFVFLFRAEILKQTHTRTRNPVSVPALVVLVHLLFLSAIILSAHHIFYLLISLVAFFVWAQMTASHQARLRVRESLLVAFFLAGIIQFGAFQKWWLEPLLSKMNDVTLFLAAAGLTAITDNAALTYLGSQVPSLSETAKFYLVAGAISGGGLTIIANAPNAAGYALLQSRFAEGFKPLLLLKAALPYTLVALIAYGCL